MKISAEAIPTVLSTTWTMNRWARGAKASTSTETSATAKTISIGAVAA